MALNKKHKKLTNLRCPCIYKVSNNEQKRSICNNPKKG